MRNMLFNICRRIEVVITGRTRNAFALRGTRVRIPPSARFGGVLSVSSKLYFRREQERTPFSKQLVGLLADAVVGACFKPYDSEVAMSLDVASSFLFTVTLSFVLFAGSITSRFPSSVAADPKPRLAIMDAAVLFFVSLRRCE